MSCRTAAASRQNPPELPRPDLTDTDEAFVEWMRAELDVQATLRRHRMERWARRETRQGLLCLLFVLLILAAAVAVAVS